MTKAQIINSKKSFDFPIKIGNEINVASYASKLTNGEEQLLITREGGLHLTDGAGDCIHISKKLEDKANQMVDDTMESIRLNANSLQSFE